MTELDLADLARSLPEERARVEALAFDPTGRWLAAVAFGVLVVYDLRDATRHAEVALPAGDGCAHALTVVARDAEGNETTLARRLVRAR